jgi:hypothetical protein
MIEALAPGGPAAESGKIQVEKMALISLNV